MAGHRALVLSAISIAMLGGGLIVISNAITVVQNEPSYTQVVPVPDVERRQERLGSLSADCRVDLTAFAEMPEDYSKAVSQYAESVLSDVSAEPVMRRRFYHQQVGHITAQRDPYPDGVNPVYDRNVVVPLVLLPRPNVVGKWAATQKARSCGWVEAKSEIESRGTFYGRTLVFKSGELSKNPKSLPASPFGTGIPSWDLYYMEHESNFFLRLGKMMVTPSYDGPNSSLMEHSSDLRLGEPLGASFHGELLTVPACVGNHRLRWANVKNGSSNRRFLAYSLLDGNGAKRQRFGFQESALGPISPYVRPLVCKRYQPKILQHDELLLPTPLRWAPKYIDSNDENAHEEWCLDDWFPAQKDACWVIREAKDSKPLQESFLLMPANEESDRPVFFIALFAETEPKQLIKELAALYKVSPDAALNSPETMQRLSSLYEKVRDFPLAK